MRARTIGLVVCGLVGFFGLVLSGSVSAQTQRLNPRSSFSNFTIAFVTAFFIAFLSLGLANAQTEPGDSGVPGDNTGDTGTETGSTCAVLVYGGDEYSTPPPPPAKDAHIEYFWRLVSRSDSTCDAIGYNLKFHSAELNGQPYGQTNFNPIVYKKPFDIPMGSEAYVGVGLKIPVDVGGSSTAANGDTQDTGSGDSATQTPNDGTDTGSDPDTDPTTPTTNQLRIYFDIIDGQGRVIPLLSPAGERLHIDFGTGMVGSADQFEQCIGATAPTIGSANINQQGSPEQGDGEVIPGGIARVRVVVSDPGFAPTDTGGTGDAGDNSVTDSPDSDSGTDTDGTDGNDNGTAPGPVLGVNATVFVNGQAYPMVLEGGAYVAEVVNSSVGFDEYQVIVRNGCFQTAINFTAAGSQAGLNGEASICSSGDEGGNQSLINSGPRSGGAGKPINTASGNFTHTFMDATVVGVGETSLMIQRTYNSNSALWSPGTVVEYAGSGDGDEGEVIAGPPRYFGVGWSSPFDTYLLPLDYGSVFQGVQVHYNDGRTATFETDGDGVYRSITPGNFDRVVEGGDGFLLYRDDCECSLQTIMFDNEGRVTAISDRNGNSIVYSYSGNRLQYIENGSGRRINITQNGDGQITRIDLPEGISLGYSYTEGLLTAFTDGRGNQELYRYNDADQLAEVITRKGHPDMRMEYESATGRATKQIVGETESYELIYAELPTTDFYHLIPAIPGSSVNDVSGDVIFADSFGETDASDSTFTPVIGTAEPRSVTNGTYGGATIVVDAYGNQTAHIHNELGLLERVEHPNGTIENYAYDNDYNRIYRQDQTGAEWFWTFDERGNRLTEDGPLATHREWSYNTFDQVTRIREKVNDSTFRETNLTYDERGNLIGFCNAIGDCSAVSVDTRGLPTEIIDLAGNGTVNAFDATTGDRMAVTDATGATTRFEYDGLGRMTATVLPLGNRYGMRYDNNDNLVALEGPLGFSLAYEFDRNDNLIRQVDPLGGEIIRSYTDSDKLARVTNQNGFNVVNNVYGLMNEIIGYADAEGRQWSVERDALLRTVALNGPLDVRFEIVYTPVGLVRRTVDANGRVDSTDYDALRRPVTQIKNYFPGALAGPDVNVTRRYSYDLVGNLLRMVDPEGYAEEYGYDLLDRRISKTDGEGHTWSYEYDPMDNLLAVLNPREYRTELAYTPTYELDTLTNAEGHSVAFDYDPNKNLVGRIDARGVAASFEFDELDRVIRRVQNAMDGMPADFQTNVVTELVYDLAGNLREMVNPRGYAAEFRYDPAHRRVMLIDFEGGETSFTYDRVDNLLEAVDAEGNPTRYEYDALDRLIGTINAESEITAYQYDPMGNRIGMVAPDGTLTRYDYDAIYRLNGVTENWLEGEQLANDVNVFTEYGYDARSLLTEIINANGALTTFSYDGVGQVVQEVNPIGDTWQYAYDGNRNRVERLDANGALTQYQYYPDDQLRRIEYADGTSVDFAYDPNNNRTSMVDSLGDTSWSFDPLNRVVATVDPFERALAFAYDPAGNRVEMTYPDGNALTYSYSPNNWMASMTDPEMQTIYYDRDRVGNITYIENPNSTVTDVSYDRVYRTLERVNRQVGGAAKVNSGFQYSYNLMGHVTRVMNQYGWRQPEFVEETYSYDGLHRLVGMNNSDGDVEYRYEYDRVGNRLSWYANDDMATANPNDGFTTTYRYNDADQMLAVAMDADMPRQDEWVEFEYDGNGNRVSRLTYLDPASRPEEGTDYSFDPENRLVEVLNYQLSGNGSRENRIDRDVTRMEYDGGGRRLVKSWDPNLGQPGVDKRTEYVFDGLDPVAEYSMLNGQRDNFYRGAQGQIAMMQHFNAGARGQQYWYHYNRKHDVVGLTKQNGNSHKNYRYDPYGVILPEVGNNTDPHNHYTLTGKEFDENTGLTWFGSRYFDSGFGLWVGQDFFRGEKQDPRTLNRFQYVLSNSVSFYDFFGFYSCDPKDDQPTLLGELGNSAKSLGKFVLSAGSTFFGGATADPLGATSGVITSMENLNESSIHLTQALILVFDKDFDFERKKVEGIFDATIYKTNFWREEISTANTLYSEYSYFKNFLEYYSAVRRPNPKKINDILFKWDLKSAFEKIDFGVTSIEKIIGLNEKYEEEILCGDSNSR